MKIICIGRNYADHAKEMNSPVPSEPMYFMKPDTAILLKKMPFYIPEFTNDLHYECELIVKINRVGKCIQKEFAHKYYDEIGLGIDFTARDLQARCKEKGHPWEVAKAFDNSAVVSQKFVSKSDLNMDKIEFKMFQNGNEVQHGVTTDMIFSIDELIAHVSKYMTLKIGDLIFTGTPAGVGPVSRGDVLEGTLEGQSMFKLDVK